MQTVCHVADQITSDKTEPFYQIENALFYPTRWSLHSDGLPLRPLSKQTRRRTSAHSRWSGTTSSTSTTRVTRRALRDRSRRSVFSKNFHTPPDLTKLPTPTRRIRANVLTTRRRARRRRSRVVPRCGRVGRYVQRSDGRRRMDVRACAPHAPLVLAADCLGTHRVAAGHIHEHRRAPTSRSRGAGLLCDATGRAAQWAEGGPA